MPSYYEALPIYEAAMNVAVRVDVLVQRFPKGHKGTLGRRLRETTLDVVMLMAYSNRCAERTRQTPLLRDRIEGLKLMPNLGKPSGNVKRRRSAYPWERPLDAEAKPEESK
jgi:hypothetical protein